MRAWHRAEEHVQRAIDESLQTRRVKSMQSQKAANDRMVAESGDDETVADVIAELEAEMLEAARKLQFEKAAKVRDQLTLQTGADATGCPAAADRQSQAQVITIKRGCLRQR